MTRVTVRRPDGTVETVENDLHMTPPLWERMVRDTRAAGRGECLSYEVVETPASDPVFARIADLERRARRAETRDEDASQAAALRAEARTLRHGCWGRLRSVWGFPLL